MMTTPTPRRIADRFPNLVVRTQHDREVRFYEDLIKDRMVMINFMFTSCPAQCPLATANLVAVQKAFGEHAGRDVFLISVTVDPTHDTPRVLKQYADRFHVQPGWTFVTGAPTDIVTIQQRLGVYDGTQHTGMVIYGNDASGSWSATPVMQGAASLARIVMRLKEPPTLDRILPREGSEEPRTG
jgi:protein SCO1/2